MISCCLSRAMARTADMTAEAREAEINRLPEQCPQPGTCTTGMGCRAYVASVIGNEAVRRREVCEARSYIRRGIATPSKVNQLIDDITKRRGAVAAERLRADMRAEWKTRSEWWHGRRA